MSTLLILLAQTRSEATIEILSFLLVAGIIGYITATLYYKSIYIKKIEAIESERTELEKQIVRLNEEKYSLHENIMKKARETKYLVKEVHALRALHAEAVHETDDMTLKNKRTEQLLYEKDEALTLIAGRKHLLDYKSFGKATLAEKDDLKMISGIGPFIEERLHALDIFTIRQISKFTTRDIKTINDAIEYFSGRIDRDEWVAQAKEIIHNKDKKEELLKRISERKSKIFYNRIGIAKKEEADDLTIISGIGGWIKEKLNILDIYTFRQISNFSEEDIDIVTDAIEYFPGRIERDEWILQAQELVRIEGKKVELLRRIRERKERISYDRLGIAHKHQANNLTLIKGIGLWIEERLNMLDIYTFEQISRLTHTDVETITEILEISPGRIDRDNWITQARSLAKLQTHQLVDHE
jgi:predicted flap endonuclease-1-like 5' DNA nuclease